MSDTAILIPDKQAILAPVGELFSRVAAIAVRTVEQDGAAKEILKEVRERKKATLAPLLDLVAKAHAAHKAATTLRNEVEAPFTKAEAWINQHLDEYETEQRRLALAEEDRLRKLAAAAEEERQLLDAIAAEDAGDEAAAEQILAEPVMVPAVTVAPAVAKVEGISSRTIWRAVVEDPLALVVYVAANPAWIGLVEPSMTALNGLARSQGSALAIPGVRAVSETSRSVRTG